MDDGLASLVKAVDRFVAENKDKRAASFVALLDENSGANQAKLTEFAKANNISTPLTIPMDGASGPPGYNLDPKARFTVLVSRRKVVKARFALANSPTDSDLRAVIKAAQEVVGK